MAHRHTFFFWKKHCCKQACIIIVVQNIFCSVRTCVVVAEERPRVLLCTAFSKLFSPLGLNSRAVSTSFGCRVSYSLFFFKKSNFFLKFVIEMHQKYI